MQLFQSTNASVLLNLETPNLKRLQQKKSRETSADCRRERIVCVPKPIHSTPQKNHTCRERIVCVPKPTPSTSQKKHTCRERIASVPKPVLKCFFKNKTTIRYYAERMQCVPYGDTHNRNFVMKDIYGIIRV
jgi:hypothetical protein